MSDETRVKTLCRMCDHGCGMEVALKDGIPVEVQGDKDHPFNRGWLCVKGRSALEFFRSEERLTSPLIRKEGRLDPAGWEEAFQFAAERLLDLRNRYGPESLAIYYGEGVGHQEIRSYVKRFANVYGTPNFCGVGSICNTSRTIAENLTFGGVSKPDIPNSRLLMIWGANPYVSHEPLPPGEIGRMKKRGGTLILVDPRRTETARRADIHLLVRPGTDDLLLLNMLHVLIVERLWDRDFVRRWVDRFEDFSRLIEEKRFSPESGEARTGIEPERVRQVVRLYAGTRPAAVFTGNGLEHHSHSVTTTRLLAIFKALTGNLDIPGGDIFTSKPLLKDITAPLPEPIIPPLGADRFPFFYRLRKEAHALCLTDAILDHKPYPIRGMIIEGGNPSMEWPNSSRVRQALQGLEFLMVIDVVRSPDSRFAHVVLPACTFLERDEHKSNVYQNFQAITLRRQVTRPIAGMPDQLIWIELAKAMGLGEHFPWKTCREGIDEILSTLGIGYEELAAKGGIHEYAERRYRKYEKGGFKTPSGKVEIYPAALHSAGYDPSPVRPGIFDAAEEEEYPLQLTTGGNLLCYLHWQYRYLPGLRKMTPEPLFEIHPDTAGRFGIADNGLAEIRTRTGRIRLQARVTPSIRPDVIHIPQGWEEANANELTSFDGMEPISGFPNYKSLRCGVRAVE